MSKLELSLFRQRWQETRKHGRQKSSAPSRVSARRSICHWHMHGGGQCLGRGTSDYSEMVVTKRSVFPWSSSCRATKRSCAVTAIAS